MRASIPAILKVFALGAGIVWVTHASSADEAFEIPLDAGVAMRVSPLPFSRWLPHAYYDQAIKSLPAIHEDITVIARRRLGYLGDIAYSLIAYRPSAESTQVILDGAVQYKDKAWRIEVTCAEDQYGDVTMQTLEVISQTKFPTTAQ